jgi:hypothetical protein
MLNKNIIDSLEDRYRNIHPLIFRRSVDHARSDVDLFDILDSFPEKYPLTWSEQERRWVVIVNDLFLASKFKVKD